MPTDSYTHLLRYAEELEMEIEDASERILKELSSLEHYTRQARSNIADGQRLPSGFDPARILRDAQDADAQRQQHQQTLNKVNWMIRTSTEQLTVDAAGALAAAEADLEVQQ